MSLMLDYLKKQDNAEPAATASKSSGSLMLDRLKELPAAAPSVPPSPVAQPLVGNAAGGQQQTITASPVVQQQAPPVVPAVSAGRNAPRVAPEDIQAPPVPEIGNQASDIDARIAANNAFASKVDDVLSPDLEGRNNTTRFNTLAPEVGQDGVTPVSVFNPPSLSQQLLSTPNQDEAKNALVRDERQRLSNVMTGAGPTVEKANLNVNPTISGVDGVPGNYTIDILGTQVPVDDEAATGLMARGNTFKLPNNAFMRGFSRANQAMAFLGSALGMTDQGQAIKVVTELNRITPDQPQELQDALREIVDADGWKDSLAAIASNPSAVLSVVAESLPMSATSLTAFIGGSIVGTPLLGATLAGTVTYGTVYQDVILSELREAGVDMNNNAAVQEMLSNPEFYARAKERAATYALPIAVFDALSMGLAGKLTGAVIKSGSKAPAIVAASVAELGMQGSLGASGEAAAQFMELERGFRDKISKGEIGLEFVAELVPGSVEVATGVYSGSQQSKQNRAQNEADAQEASAVDEIARGLLSSNNAQMTQVGAEPTGSLLLDAMQRAEEFSAPAAQPVAAQPVVEQVAAQPVVEQVAAQPVVEQPVVEQPVVEQVFTSKTVPQMVNGKPSTDSRETLTSISDGTNTRYITHYRDDEDGFGDRWVEVDESGNELDQQPSFWMDGSNQKRQAIEFMEEEMAAPAAEPAPAVEPVAASPAPAAEQDNPQAKPVIPFARPVADAGGQQKSVTISTPDNQVKVQAKPVILDAADLKAATGNLQPRDRSLTESEIEVQRRAGNLDPARLLESPTSDNGAPIVARDGTIISGNGRVLSLRAAYSQFPEKAAEYKQAIANYGTSDANYDNPVLVMMIDQDMSFEQLADFADRSNRSAIATMSATERAQRDAQAMDVEMINLFQGGAITSLENQGFVQQFTKSVVAPTEQNQISRDGKLTKEGVQRMESAILATAYEDTDALAIMLDSTDDNIKAISRAMLDAAPRFAQLKADISSGSVKAEFDISKKVTEAARKISDLRNKGIKPRDFFAQQDAFNQVDPDVEALIRSFYNEELTRAKSQRIMADVLKFYTEEASQKKQGGFFEDTTTPRDVIELARRKADGTEGQTDLLSDAKQRTSRSLNESSQQTQRTAPKRSGKTLKELSTESTQARLANAERTRRAEADNQETLGTTEDSVLAVSDLDSQRTEKPGTLVDKMSMRRYSSLQGQAFVDAGIDPAIGKNMPIERQFKILSDLMSSKFGLAHVVKTDTANKKEAVDQLLAGYHNLNNLAYELGLPTQAMGLEGTLSFVAAADTGAYGTYSPSEQTITLPRRSNSFAHEWFHALDHYLLEKYGSGEATKMPLATEAVRKYGNEAFAPDAPISVKESYFALMRALFKDKATEAAQLMAIDQKMAGMEQRAAKSGKDVNAMPTYQKLKAQKQRILESTGKSKKVGKSQMRKDAEFFAEIIDQGVDYWASPAEMGARAFEAFAIDKVTNAGLQTAFLGKTDEGYTMTLEQLGVTRQALASPKTQADMLAVLDSRLALTFPKADERKNIFGAMQNLMDAIRVETELGQGDKAELIGNDFATDMRELHNVPEPVSKGILADYKQARREAKNLAEREKLKVSQYTERYKGKKKAIIGEKGFVIPMKHFAYIEDTVMAPLFYQKQGILKAMIKRYPDNRRLKRIYQKLGTHTGGELQSTYEGDTLFNAQARQVRIFSERMKNAVVGAEYNMFTQEEVTQLRDIMISEDNVDASPKVVKLAGQLRDIYNNMYDYLRSSGLDIGYAPNGYVQRILDHAEVSNDTAKFETQARKVYDIVWEQDLGVIDEGNLDQMLETIKYIQEARLGIEELDQKTGEKVTLGSRSDYKDFVKSTAWTDIKDLLGALKVEQKKDNPDQIQIDSLKAELKQQAADIAPKFEEFYNAMQGHFSRMKAINYRQSINHSHVGGSQDGSPQASFTKKRKLPPEADKLMEQFYISDPVENLTNYILGAVRKAEYNRRFGKHLIPAPGSKNEYADALDYELKQLTDKDGITATEVNEIENAISNMLGRNMDGKMPTMLQKGSNRAAAMLSVTLLIRAPIASIAEPFTVAMTTGSAKKGLMSFASTMQEFPGLRNLGNAQEDIRLRHQFARIMGIIDDPEVGDIMTNRIGGEFAGDPAVSRMMASFFAKIKLSGITNAQRRSAAKIGFQYITEMAYEIKNPSSLRNQKQARLVMQDLGVADSRMDQFVDYILSFNEHNDKGNFVGKMELPTADKVFADESGAFSDMGMQLAVSIMRFTDQSIQDPRTVDRPLWAENGIGRIVYGITSFIYSFQDKVLKPMARKTAREYGMSRDEGKGKVKSGMDAGTAAALNSAIPLATLFSAHALVSTAREYIFNQDRWDREWEEADKDELKFIGSYLLPLAFTRSGLTGAFDPLFQAFTGLKYQRDIANTFLGTGGYVAQNIQDIAKYWVNNSENTVSNEFKALRGIYNLTVNPIASFLLATSNLTPATAYIGTGAAMTVTSTDFKNAMINRWLNFYYGQTYTPGKGGRKSKSVNYTNK